MLIDLIVAVLGVSFLLWPEAARRAVINAYARIGLTVDPPRATFVRLIGFGWLLVWFFLPRRT